MTQLRGHSLNHPGVPSRLQGDGEHSTDDEEEEDCVSVSPGDSNRSDTPSLDGSTPGEEEFDVTPALSEVSSGGSSCNAEERLGTEGQEGEPEVVAQQPVLEGDGEGSESGGGGSSPSCGDGREGSEEPPRRTGGAGDGVDDLSELGQGGWVPLAALDTSYCCLRTRHWVSWCCSVYCVVPVYAPPAVPLPSVGAPEDTLATSESSFLGSVDPPSMMEDTPRWSLFEPSQLQPMMDRDSMARSIRPPIMAGQEGVEGGQAVPPQPNSASVSSAAKGSPHEDSPVVLPSASTARSSFLSRGSLVHSDHQRPVALGEKEGEWDGAPQPGVAKVASEGYFSAPEGSHDMMTMPPVPLGLDPALTRESQLEDGPRHSSSSSSSISVSPPTVAGDPSTVSLGLPEAQNVLEQLAQLHPTGGREGRESSDTLSAISSEGSVNFEDTQQPHFNPFDSGTVCVCTLAHTGYGQSVFVPSVPSTATICIGLNGTVTLSHKGQPSSHSVHLHLVSPSCRAGKSAEWFGI